MELEVLKDIWIETIEKQAREDVLSSDYISEAIEKKSNTVISKIRSRLKLKTWLQGLIGIIGSALSLVLLVKSEPVIGVFYLVIFPMILILAFHKFNHYKMIVDFQKGAPTLRETIVLVLEIMKQVIRAQITTSVILSVMFAALLTYMAFENSGLLDLWQQVLLLSLIILLVPFLSYQLAKNGQQKMFGRYLDQLREYLIELDEHNEVK